MNRTCNIIATLEKRGGEPFDHLEIVQVIFFMFDRPKHGGGLCEGGEQDDGLGVVVPQHCPECIACFCCWVLSDHKLFHLRGTNIFVWLSVLHPSET